ncbi:hypothetical protein GCM10027598_60210 [Amycolatopsis oliviviridis]|uniref:DUF6917 domain-containing protein n=1 Tax=Amycolatopsis oliviviridis TaxID=1471590 RepID=A0ABQ3MEN5_9PSEU|nr:hypothetical protein [Amycolatopsis oliviviridis]GHH38106.1 hypothetical protein GCM10017790_83380 [Amycolatopsis oliviviridis]
MRDNGSKREVTGTLVKVLAYRRDDRGMSLEPFASRCVRTGEIHELVTTTHTDPGAPIDDVGFLGFAEIDRAGVLDQGDEVWIGTKLLGTVLGFDASHFPDHYAILIHNGRTITGEDVALEPEQQVRFRAW